MAERGEFNGTSSDRAAENFIRANEKGLIKIMSKMGISTVQSYRGAQIFEAIGLSQELVEQYFTWTPSRIEGIGLEVVEEEALQRHRSAFAQAGISGQQDLEIGSFYQWRRDGEVHQWNPESIASLQYAAKTNNWVWGHV